MTDSASPIDWSRISIGPRRPGVGQAANADPGATRFVVGLSVFLVVAALYPWYSYRVQTRLAAREIEAYLEAMDREEAQAARALRAQTAATNKQLQSIAQAARLRSVVVRGVGEGNGTPVVIVDLGSASLHEATPIICRQARAMRGHAPFEPRWIVQRSRGQSPAVTVGSIRCEG